MSGQIQAGVFGHVPIQVTAVDDAAGTCSLRVVDNNGNPLSPAAPGIPQGVVTPLAPASVAVNDVLESLSATLTGGFPQGATLVVRWVSGDGRQWSPVASGSPTYQTLGWKKDGTATLA